MLPHQHLPSFTVPSDVLTEIAQYLHPDITEGGQAALASLALASRRTYQAANNELYVAPRLSSIMQWVQFLETLRSTGEPDIERRVRRLDLRSPISGFRYREATRDATFVPIAIDILRGCTKAKHLILEYHPRLMPIIDVAKSLTHITNLCIVGELVPTEIFLTSPAQQQRLFPSVTSLTLVRCSYQKATTPHQLSIIIILSPSNPFVSLMEFYARPPFLFFCDRAQRH